jgi:hypothetical protein
MGKRAAQLPAPAEPDAPDEPKPDPFGLINDGKANKKLLADPTAPGVTTKKNSLPPSAFRMPDNRFHRDTDLDLINPGTGRINSIDNAYKRKAMHVPNYSVKPIYSANNSQSNYFSTPAGRQLLPNSNLESSFFRPLIKDMDNRIGKELDAIEPLARAKEYHTKNTANPLISSKYMETVKNRYEQRAAMNSDKLFPWIRPGENPEEVLSRPGVVEEQRSAFDHFLSDPVRRGTMDAHYLPDKDKFEGTQSVLGEYPSQMSVADLHPVTLGSLDSINGAQDPRTRNLSPPFLTRLNPSPAYPTSALDPMTGRFNFSPKGLDPEKQRAIERANLAGKFLGSNMNYGGMPDIRYHNFLGPEFHYGSGKPDDFSRRAGENETQMGQYVHHNIKGKVHADTVDSLIQDREMIKKYRDAGSEYPYISSNKLIRGDKGWQRVSDKENEVDPKGHFDSDYDMRYLKMLINRKISEKGELKPSPLSNFYDNAIRAITGAEDRPSAPGFLKHRIGVPGSFNPENIEPPKPLATVSRASMLSDLKEPPEVLPPTKNPNSIEEAIKRSPDNLNTFFNSLSNSAFGSMSNRRTPTYVGPRTERRINNLAIGDNTNESDLQGSDLEFIGRINSPLNKLKTDVNGKVLPGIMKAETGLLPQTFSRDVDAPEDSPDPRRVDLKFSDLYTPENVNIAASNKLIRGDAGFQLLGSAQNEGLKYSPNTNITRGEGSNSPRNEELYAKPQAFLSNLAQILATSHAMHEVPGVKPVKLDLLSDLNSQQIADIVKQDDLFGVGKKDILSWLSSNSPNATAFLNSLQQEHQPTWKEEATLYPSEKEKIKHPFEAPAQQKLMPSRSQLIKSIEG